MENRHLNANVIARGAILAVFLFSVSGCGYKLNSDDAFSHAAGFAMSKMWANRASSIWGCEPTDAKPAAEWYTVSVSDKGNGKYYVLGAMKAIDEFCYYEAGYFAATVYYSPQASNWMLDGDVYFTNECMLMSHVASTTDVCQGWSYDWQPDMNWRP